ncbi:MAG: hypothetical protein KIA99_04440 [Actinomyces urogenitalis]|uniref:hypothetical protein n=1 Tax=Actinomyces urogenitalis TaxID=103621 RepID=UPI00242E0372|nr:hypothetical protein [Actinomyces urogenitalis]MBS5976834.1 hypothetical protein [Actinomyces urogenitalis]MDU7427938.1 hypothetical protein [Actinomyces urogenitalis]
MSTYDEVVALGDKHLSPKPSEDETLAFEASIGDDESVVFEVVSRLNDAGIPIPPALLRDIQTDYGWSETLVEKVDTLLTAHALDAA